jgi:hypothetical protein
LTDDFDGLNELFDKGAYHKVGPFGLNGIMAAFRRHNLEAHIPLIIAVLYVLSGDYISLLRQLRMVI